MVHSIGEIRHPWPIGQTSLPAYETTEQVKNGFRFVYVMQVVRPFALYVSPSNSSIIGQLNPGDELIFELSLMTDSLHFNYPAYNGKDALAASDTIVLVSDTPFAVAHRKDVPRAWAFSHRDAVSLQPFDLIYDLSPPIAFSIPTLPQYNLDGQRELMPWVSAASANITGANVAPVALFDKTGLPLATFPVSGSVDVSDRAARLVGKVDNLIAAAAPSASNPFPSRLTDGAAFYDARSIRALTSTDVVDVSDRAARLTGKVDNLIAAAAPSASNPFPSRLSDGAAFYDARSIRALTSTDVVDVSDRAARLVGKVDNLIAAAAPSASNPFPSRLTDGAAFYDARQIRALTASDIVKANQGTANTVANAWPIEVTDGIDTATVMPSQTLAAKTDAALVVALSPNNAPQTTLNQPVPFTTGGTLIFTMSPIGQWSFQAVYRLAARPYALSNAFGGAGRKQYATIHHLGTAAKHVFLRHVWVAIESSSVAAIIVAELIRINTAPVTGNPAITPGLGNVGQNAEAVCLALPTTAGTETGSPLGMAEWNLGITGAGSTVDPPPPLQWVDLLLDQHGPSNVKQLPYLTAFTLAGFAVTIDSSALATIKAFVIIEFSEVSD